MLDKFITLFESQLKDRHLSELLKGSSVALVFKVFGIATGYIFILLITRNFGAEAMGIFALSFTVLQISSVIGRLGFDTALLRFVAEYSSQNRPDLVKEVYVKVIKIIVPFSLLLSVFLYFSDDEVAAALITAGMRGAVGESMIDFATPRCKTPEEMAEKSILRRLYRPECETRPRSRRPPRRNLRIDPLNPPP